MLALRRTIMLVMIVLVFATAVSALSTTYSVSHTGEAEVTINVEERQAIILTPEKISKLEVKDATYERLPQGLSVISNGDGVVKFSSSFYTSKSKGIWYFEAVPGTGNALLKLPINVKIVKAEPFAQISANEGIDLFWANATQVSVSYIFKGEQSIIKNPTSYFPGWGVISLIVIGLLVITLFLILKNKKTEKVLKPKISDGQMNIMRAANENEALLLKTLMKFNGHIKRNILERETEMPKSSLASTLHSLEKKNIVSVDRTFHVHYISATDWFKNL